MTQPENDANHPLNQEERDRNIAKYGNPDDDVIERAYRESKFGGDFYCYKNAEKYLRRFCSNSAKAGNPMDIKKALDYINRMWQHNQPTTAPKEVIEGVVPITKNENLNHAG